MHLHKRTRIYSFTILKFAALQKRNLQCLMENGTVLDPILCNEKEKPSQKRECFNEKCQGTWKAGDWSAVSRILPIYTKHEWNFFDHRPVFKSILFAFQC